MGRTACRGAAVGAGLAALTGFLLSCGAPPVGSGEPPIHRVGHFNIRSPDVSALVEALSRHLGLPVLWPATQFGSVTVAGLSFGNTVVELIDDGATDGAAMLAAIAFEPAGGAKAAAGWLTDQGFEHTAPSLYPPEAGDADGPRQGLRIVLRERMA